MVKGSPRLFRLIEPLVDAKEGASVAVMRAATRVPGGTTVYYSLLRHSFHGEQRRVAAGRLAYWAGVDEVRSYARLRRNVHRLEKGLTMVPRRFPFGLGYLESIVQDLEVVARLSTTGPSRRIDVDWAVAVLDDYFAIGSDPAVDALAERFARVRSSLAPPSCEHDVALSPYPRGDAEPPVAYDQLLALARRRRSVRWFLDKPIDRELVDRAIEVAVLSPSACNRVPYRFIVLEGETAQRVAAIAGGTGGYAEQLPAVALVVGDHSAYAHERDRHAPYIDASLAVLGLAYALESQGMASCCINWPEVAHREKSLRTAVPAIADHESVVMMVAIGWPDPAGLVPSSPKKELDRVRTYGDLGRA